MIRLKKILSIFTILAFFAPVKADITKPFNHVHEGSSIHLWNISSADYRMDIDKKSRLKPKNSNISKSKTLTAKTRGKEKVNTNYDSDHDTSSESENSYPTNSTKNLNGTKAKLKILNVGQGNFVVLEVPGAPGANPQILVVDGGSSSRGTIATTADQETSTVKGFGVPTQSNLSADSVHKEFMKFGNTSPDKLAKDFQTKILGGGGVPIKTIVLTHADADHYNLLDKIFSDTKVENIILSGDLSSYKDKFIDKNGDAKKFLLWLEKKHKEKTKIFMPGASYEAIPEGTTVAAFIEKNVNNFAPTAYKGADDKFHVLGELKISTQFVQAFNFGNDVKIYPLSINPLRELNKKNKKLQRKSTTKFNYEDGLDKINENDDSTVIKIVNGESSALLTGDATEHTYNSIKKNFGNNKEFLKSKILLLSHHGTKTNGSNSKEWLGLIQPEFVAVSNSIKHDSMEKEVYDSVVAMKSLFTLKSKSSSSDSASPLKDFLHKVEYSVEKKKYDVKLTHKFIFTTLSSGSLLFDLMNDGKIELAIDNNIIEDKKESSEGIQRIIYMNYEAKHRTIKQTRAEYEKSIIPTDSILPIETDLEEADMDTDIPSSSTTPETPVESAEMEVDIPSTSNEVEAKVNKRFTRSTLKDKSKTGPDRSRAAKPWRYSPYDSRTRSGD